MERVGRLRKLKRLGTAWLSGNMNFPKILEEEDNEYEDRDEISASRIAQT